MATWKYLVILLSVFVTRSQSKGPITCTEAGPCPFDDLTSDEITKVVSIIRNSGYFPPDIRYSIIRTQEPPKADWLEGRVFDYRFAYVALFSVHTNILTEALVDINGQYVKEHSDLPAGISPPIMFEEYTLAESVIRSNAAWAAAVQRRGIDPLDARLDIWGPGPLSPAESGPGRRILRAIVNYKDPKSRHWYWAVIEGLIVTVDLASLAVVDIWDTQEDAPLTSPMEESDFTGKPPLKPLLISQPEGSSIQVRGHQIEWYKWKFQYSVDPICGLQLYHVRYNGDCEERSVFYKVSMTEMFVPYGAPGQNWRWRSAFDAGEYGIGKLVNPLKVGIDAPENALLFDCIMGSETGGEPVRIPGCVAAYERDIGMLYKHSDSQSWEADGRRGRVLVLSLMTTVANYDYTFDYIFHMDGTMEIKTRLTGILLIRGTNSSINPVDCLEDCSNMLNDYLIGPAHQHFFNYRIDLDVDGVNNYVTEVNLTPDPYDPANPMENGIFSAKKEIIRSETHRDFNFQTERSWHVVNTESRNKFGTPRGYALKPGSVAYPFLTEENPFWAHAQFVTHPTWMTKYKDNEQSACDKFPRTGLPGEGLPKYIQDSESLENTDVVLWHTFGVTHSSRPEEWPIMNIHTAGFTLIPFNFLSQNSEMPLKDRCQ